MAVAVARGGAASVAPDAREEVPGTDYRAAAGGPDGYAEKHALAVEAEGRTFEACSVADTHHKPEAAGMVPGAGDWVREEGQREVAAGIPAARTKGAEGTTRAETGPEKYCC